MTLNAAEFEQWQGKTRQEQDLVTRTPVESMAALLDLDPADVRNYSTLPPLWHWLYFHSPVRQSQLADDGHPRRGDFLPPIELPRRMWAGGRLTFTEEIPLGSPVNRTSTISNIATKQGRSGQLAFITVTHDIRMNQCTAILEEHDIVYRDRPAHDSSHVSPAGTAAPSRSDFSARHKMDITRLFRYSALTFNAHRIHYDRQYAMETEGYPGLVVHGPLLATLLVELLRNELPGVQLRKFSFRALRPVFENQSFTANAKIVDQGECHLWIADQDSLLCMEATAFVERVS